jgi:hypothetical protein
LLRGGRRGRHRHRWIFEELEDRTLLATIPANLAQAIPLGTPQGAHSGTVGPGSPVFFQINPASDALLIAHLTAPGLRTRLALLDSQGQLVVQSDGQSANDPDDVLAQHIGAGTDYLELQSLAGSGNYTLTTQLTESSQPGVVGLGTLPSFSPSAIVAGDFNGDGRTDLAVGGSDSSSFQAGASEVEVLLSKGDGTFQTTTPTSLGSLSPSFLLAGDFRGDGHTDLAVAGKDNTSLQNEVEVLLGRGDGTFQTQAPINLGRLSPTSLVTGDFTGNGHTDLAVVDSDPTTGQTEVEVLLSKGGGAFQSMMSTNLGPFFLKSVVTGDFNGDGRTDLVVSGYDSSSGQGEVEALLASGDGTFKTLAPTDLSGFVPQSLVAGDFNGDGRTDLAVAGSDSASSQEEIRVLLGNGDGTFQATTPNTSGGLSASFLVTGDFNGDGRTDLAVAGSASFYGPGEVAVLMGNGDGTFQAPTPVNSGGLSPSFLCTGDFTGDGRTGLALEGNDSPSGPDGPNGPPEIELLLDRDPTFQFTLPTPLVGSHSFSPSALATGDFTGDGRTDLAVAGFDSASGQNELELLLGSRYGALQTPVPINLGTVSPSAVVAGGFTSDGRTDLAVAGFDSASGQNELELLLGNGDGTFQAATPVDLGTLSPASLVVGDFAADSTGLAVLGTDSASGQDEVEVLLGNGDGTFQAGMPISLGSLSTHLIVTGDFNGDGHTDLAVAGYDSSSLQKVAEVLLGNGDGTFQASTGISLGGLSPSSLAVGDFTGNGPAELAVAGSDSTSGQNQVEVFLANGDRTLHPTTPVNLGSLSPSSLATGDFNGDGHTDLAVAGSDSASSQNEAEVLLGKADGTFQATTLISLGTLSPSILVTGDFNRDGRTDLAVAGVDSGSGQGEVKTMLNSGPTLQPTTPIRAGGSFLTSLMTGDFNGDGRTDLVMAGFDATSFQDEVKVLPGNGDGTFQTASVTKLGTLFPSIVVTGDFNGDGRTDLAVAGFDSSSGQEELEVLLGHGGGTFQTTTPTPLGNLTPSLLVPGDFKGNGHLDLVLVGTRSLPGANEIDVLPGNGDGTFQTPSPIALSGFFDETVVTGDFNGDGRTDLAVAGDDATSGQPKLEVLLSQGDGTFQATTPIGLGEGYGPLRLATGDFNGDGHTDLAAAYSGELEVLLGHGDGTFQTTTPISVDVVGPSSLLTADFTGDGRTDLAVAGIDSSLGNNAVEVLLGHGDGTFQTTTPLNLGGVAFGASSKLAVAGDFNDDGRADLASTQTISPSGQAAVQVFLGNGDGTFQTQASANLSTLSQSPVVAGDFTGDGRTDLVVVTNDGPGQTAVEVLLGDGDGTFPTMRRTDLGGLSLQSLVAGDFNGDGRTDLAGVIIGPGGQLGVEVLLGNGDGTFQTTPPINLVGIQGQEVGLVAGDFNADGRTDLALVEDFPTETPTELEVLLGKGDGTFQTTAPIDLNLYVISSLVTGDFTGDGRTDLAVAGFDSSSQQNKLEVLLSEGDGTLQATPPIDLGGINTNEFLFLSSPLALLVTGDFTGDGRTDLAVVGHDSSSGQNEVEVLLSSGDGTFQISPPINLGPFVPSSGVAGDFRGHGRTDLAVAGLDSASNQYEVKVLLGKGDGTFQLATPTNLGSFQASSLGGDFNGDGRTDLVVNGPSGFAVKLSLGDGQFADAGTLAASIENTPLLADPGDGTQDVFVINQSGSILWRQGNPAISGSFDPPITVNPGFPSRDIAFVTTERGPLLASVDLKDDVVSLYQYSGGGFVRVGSLATGPLPTRIVAGDLTGDGIDDLVVYNAGDGTVSVYLGTRIGGFAGGSDVPVGLGATDIALADVEGAGHLDLVVANEITGLVTVLPGKGDATFGDRSIYPAGAGPYGMSVAADGTAQVTSNESTAGVAIGTFTPGAAPGLATIDPGTNSFALLAGLGGGAFANPVRVFTSTPASLVRGGDFNGDGLTDLALLGPDGVTIYMNDGKGNLHPTATYNVGPDPTGLALADLNHDGKLDLLVANALGDILVLLGNGDGTFRPYRRLDQNVALAVLPTSSPTPGFIFADQGLDRVVVASGSGSTVLGNRATGIDNPGAVQLADLNGGGIPDLIVVNSGGNNVLVYPGLGNGQFGPELNGGKGFSVGTDPVSVTVADVNGDGRPDLVVANNGSNDVSLLINTPTSGGGFTFMPGPRLHGGQGPTSTVLTNVPGNSFPDILVSDGASNLVTLLPGVGNGFFNDQNPRTYSVGSDPGPIMIGNFLPGPGPEILTVNRGSNDVTVISDFLSRSPVFDTVSTGGDEPVAAFGFEPAGQSLESLVVANSGNGLFSLLGGPDGLGLEQTLSNPELPTPSALALAALGGNEVLFYATTAGMEAAFTLAFILPGFTPVAGPAPGSPGALAQAPGQLVALSETSLALVGTLIVTVIGAPAAPAAGFLVAGQTQADVNAASGFVALAPSQGQGLFAIARRSPGESEGGEPVAPTPEVAQGQPQAPAPAPARGQGALAPPWVRSLLGLDRLFEQIRREHEVAPPVRDEGDPAAEDASPAAPAPAQDDDSVSGETIDAALQGLGPVPRGESVARSEPYRLFARDSGGASPSRSAGRRNDAAAAGVVLAAMMIVIRCDVLPEMLYMTVAGRLRPATAARFRCRRNRATV